MSIKKALLILIVFAIFGVFFVWGAHVAQDKENVQNNNQNLKPEIEEEQEIVKEKVELIQKQEIVNYINDIDAEKKLLIINNESSNTENINNEEVSPILSDVLENEEAIDENKEVQQKQDILNFLNKKSSN